MDFFLEQLYQIQFLREYLGPAGITFMNVVSQNMLALLGIIPLYIFWCCDKKAGRLFFSKRPRSIGIRLSGGYCLLDSEKEGFIFFMHIIHDPYWFLKSLFRGSHITRRYYRHFRIYYFTHDIYETDSLVLECP